MDPMIAPRHDDGGALGRHQGFPGQQVPYHQQLRRKNPGPFAHEATDELMQLPTLHTAHQPPPSPRWDSAQSALRSPSSPRHPPPFFNDGQLHPQPRSPIRPRHYDGQHQQPHPRSPIPPQHYDGQFPPQPRSPARPHYNTSGTPFDHRGEPNARSLNPKSSLPDLRGQDGVANFSRPRKQSLMQSTAAEASQSRVPSLSPPPSDQAYSMTGSTSPRTPPWHRPHAPSAAGSPSAAFPPGPPHPANERPGSRGPRWRGPPGPPPHGPARTFGFSRVESFASAPGDSGSAPWLSGDEFRSSYRSQMTASTTPGTFTTERSSVLTKGSSIPSVCANPEEPSIDDVMDMYEVGFDDDDGEDDDADSSTDVDDLPDTNLAVPRYETERRLSEISRRLTIAGAMDEELPEPPSTFGSSLAAEIRQSKLIFSSPAFIASVPHIAGNLSSARNSSIDLDKRDSGKSIDSDPSATSDSPADKVAAAEAKLTGASRDELNMSANSSSSIFAPASDDDMPSFIPPPSSKPAPRMPVPDPEPPGLRDRYGFKKENHSITRKQYDSWEKGYSEYLARRKKKWVAYLKENALMTDRPNRFPAPNAKTKRFVRKGIPPEWRGAAWFYYAGGPAILAKHSGLYYKLSFMTAKPVDAEAIERDLHRTFPDNIEFKPNGGFPPMPGSQGNTNSNGDSDKSEKIEPPIIGSLRRVLHAFSVYNPHIGYCQSLNFIAGLLLLFVETEEQCFWLLNVITHIYLPGTHAVSLEGSKVDLGVLMTELRDTLPAVWDKIGGDLEAAPRSRPSTAKSLRKTKSRLRRKDQPELSTERLPPITLCMTSWFMSCYVGTLPIETTLRVWDVFFYEGSQTLFRIALGIFKQGESEIKSVSDPMEMFGVVQALPRRMLDANELMEACFKKRNGFNHLNQEAIDEKRQEKRDQTQQEKDQGSSGVRSTSSSSTPSVGRKGTLFGIKKRDASRTRT